ncbi:feruloyl esterase B [Xylariomycetidae sp. FL0641]|nr:feruloyl esterase B [Xylariomycetidae sp. FL0641]
MLTPIPFLFAGSAIAASVSRTSSVAKRQGTPCASLTAPEISGATLVSLNATEAAGTSSTAAHCEVKAVLTHGDAGDNVNIITWLPLDAAAWNGRYQGTGGGGFTAGGDTSALVAPIADGYAAGTTDAGLPFSLDGTEFAGDEQLITNFAHLSVHEMTVLGKDLARQFYGTDEVKAYWNGCSTGGRQGYMEAQRYPTDYNGVYAASPAVNWDRFHVAMLWPFVVQNVEGEFVPQCVFDTLTAAAIDACDLDDGGADKLISNPTVCDFDAASMVGETSSCASDAAAITDKQALIWNKIAAGPVDATGAPLWTGIAKGASYSSLAGQQPFALASGWTRGYVLKDLDFDLATITYETFPDIFAQSHEEWHELIGADDADLSPFQAAGGKLLSWHGWGDPLIFANGTVNYRERVQTQMGGAEAVNEFYRLYLAPGVGHCGGGGPTPTDPFNALVAWAEDGTVPETLAAADATNSRNLCSFPLQLQYSGEGDITAAESWTCV